MPGYKDWVDGVALPASDMDDYISKQVVNKQSSAANRDAAITGAIKREGMVVYQDDVNSLLVSRDGTAGNYSTIGPVHGALTTWTPVITQSGTVTCTVTYAVYSRVGRRIFYDYVLTVTGSGTGGNQVTVTLPVTAVTTGGGFGICGFGVLTDNGTGGFPGIAEIVTSTTMRFRNVFTNGIGAYLGANGFTAALAAGDVLAFSGSYEAAGDA